MKRPRRQIDPEVTREIGIGPLNLDVTAAMRGGWSPAEINRVWRTLERIGQRMYARTHAAGHVASCDCVACDPKVPTADLPDDYKSVRRRWPRSWRYRSKVPRRPT